MGRRDARSGSHDLCGDSVSADGTATSPDRGATAVIVAATMVLLVGLAAVAIDLGAGFNERRLDQIAADAGSLAGALESINGGSLVTQKAAEFVAANLGSDVATMAPSWRSCVDPAAERNTQPNDNFVSLAGQSPWLGGAPVDPANWCMSFDPVKQLFRVRVPDQFTDTSFGRVLGVSSLTTGASAVSEIVTTGQGGILPFGLDNGPAGGEHACLSSAPNGLTVDPCDGSTTGNFGTLKGRQFGNPFIGTDENCTASPVGQTLSQNIALGLDHVVVTDPDGVAANEVRDVCKNPLVDTLNTDTGFPNNGTEEGLVGPVPATSYGAPTPRLKAVGPYTSSIFNGHQINDQPLWTYLVSGPDYGGTATPSDPSDDAPLLCDPTDFAGGPGIDYDGDGTVDPRQSWQHMQRCLSDYAAGSFSTVIFSETLLQNTARFAYIPQFWESSLGNGNSWNHIRRFRAVYLNITVWKKGTAYAFHAPGEACTGCNSNGWDLKQLTAYTFPDEALPELLRGEPLPPSPGLNPLSSVELER